MSLLALPEPVVELLVEQLSASDCLNLHLACGRTWCTPAIRRRCVVHRCARRWRAATRPITVTECVDLTKGELLHAAYGRCSDPSWLISFVVEAVPVLNFQAGFLRSHSCRK